VSDPLTRIILIRHGVNDYIAARRLAARLPGVHLNEQGRAQAEALARRLADVPLAAVYSSPLERTVETAQPLAASHGLSVVVVEGIGETDCGEWTGRLVDEVSQTELWRQILVYPSGVRFPGGEGMADVQKRMVTALESLRQAHPGQTIAVVSHSDPIKTALAYYIGLHLDLYHRLVISPASISELEFTPYGPRLLRCNDCAHLQGLM
jgi:probable phosphomutase (TIGR03848 family)